MSSTIGSILSKSQTALIIPKPALDIDAISAAFSLAASLIELQKEVSLFLSPPQQKLVAAHLDNDDINIVDAKSLDNWVLSLKNVPESLNDISWTNKDGKLDIVFKHDELEIDQDDIKLGIKKRDYDVVLMVGFSAPEELGEFYQQSRELFEPAKTITISKKQDDKVFQYKQFPLFTANISQSVFYFMREFKLPLTNYARTMLLSGIIFGTDNFKVATSVNTFAIAGQLIKNGGDLELALRSAINNKSFTHTKFYSYVYSGLKMGEQGFYHVIIDSSTLGKGSAELELLSNKTPFIELSDCQYALTIVETKAEKNIYLQTKDTAINLVKKFQKYHPDGSPERIHFSIEGDSQNIVEQIRASLLENKEPEFAVEESSTESKKEDKKADSSDEDLLDFDFEAAADSLDSTEAEASEADDAQTDPLSPAKEKPKPLELEKKVEQSSAGNSGPLPPAN